MTRQAGPVVGAWALALMLAVSTQSEAQESLASARQLYASADYKSALTMLNALLGASPSPQERQSIELYRTFCLVAIGNTDEANKAIESMVSRDPLYRPNMDDVPPRLRTVFSDARKRLLPALIQERYIIAKAAFDRSDTRSPPRASRRCSSPFPIRTSARRPSNHRSPICACWQRVSAT